MGLDCDSSFEWNDSYGRTPSGRRWNHTVWASRRTLDGAGTTIGCLSRQCFGSCGRGALGVLFRRSSASGTVPSRDTATGSKPVFSVGFLRHAPKNRIWNTPWSTPPSSRSIATARAQKGDSEPGHRPLQGRHDDQNLGAYRRSRQSRALRSAAGSAVRYGRRRTTHRRPLLDALIADKAFDSHALIADLDERGPKGSVSQPPRRAKPLPIDDEMYKWRHLI